MRSPDSVTGTRSTYKPVPARHIGRQASVKGTGKWWKEIFTRVVEDASITGDDVETAIAATSTAKNNLRRRCGWAPTHIVFGRSPRDEDDIHDKEVDDGYLVPQTADDAQRRRESIRSSAKAAFLRVRAEDKIRRGTLQRARVRPRDLPNGEMALFWRKDKNNKKGAWRGPGVVIGRQHEKLLDRARRQMFSLCPGTCPTGLTGGAGRLVRPTGHPRGPTTPHRARPR